MGIPPKQIDHQDTEKDMFFLYQTATYLHEIKRVMQIMEQEHIPFLILKGSPLHLWYEQSYPKRRFWDVDLLFSRTDLPRVIKLFISLGYTERKYALSKENQSPIDPPEMLFQQFFKNFPVVFDLHVEPVFMLTQVRNLDALYPSAYITQMADEFLQERRTITIEEDKYTILAPHHLVVYLCLHFFHHNFCEGFRLKLIDKVMRIEVKRSQNSYERMQKCIQKYHLQNYVYPAFLLLQKHHATPIPDSFLNQIQPKSRIVKWYIKHKVLPTSIDRSEERMQAGLNRFILLLLFSPVPILQRWRISLNKDVLKLGILVMRQKLAKSITRGGVTGKKPRIV